MRKVVLALIGVMMFGTVNALAADDDSDKAEKSEKSDKAMPHDPAKAPADSSGAKYGPAGCGLGSMIFSPDSGFTQIFAATTNGTSANQTFGITSGTSNCDSGPSSSKTAKVYIQTNREALAKDIARGSGETIAGLSRIAGCTNSSAVGASLQKSFKVIFPQASQSDDVVADKVVSTLRSDKGLACHI